MYAVLSLVKRSVFLAIHFPLSIITFLKMRISAVILIANLKSLFSVTKFSRFVLLIVSSLIEVFNTFLLKADISQCRFSLVQLYISLILI